MSKPLVLALALALALTLACTGGDVVSPASKHPLVGTYDVTATFPTFRPDVRQPTTTTADATLTGTIVVADTVEPRGALTFFPDVRVTTVFCGGSGTVCNPPETHDTFTTLFDPPSLTIGWSDSVGRILHFDGPFAGDSIAGPAYYQIGVARYDGRFVARRRR